MYSNVLEIFGQPSLARIDRFNASSSLRCRESSGGHASFLTLKTARSEGVTPDEILRLEKTCTDPHPNRDQFCATTGDLSLKHVTNVLEGEKVQLEEHDST